MPSEVTVWNQHLVKYPAGLIKTSNMSSHFYHVNTGVLIGLHVVSSHLTNNMYTEKQKENVK